LVLGRHSSFYAYMNIDLATQVVIGRNFFLRVLHGRGTTVNPGR
jgi:cation transport regulator ChaC